MSRWCAFQWNFLFKHRNAFILKVETSPGFFHSLCSREVEYQSTTSVMILTLMSAMTHGRVTFFNSFFFFVHRLMFQENIRTILFRKWYLMHHYPEQQNKVSHPKRCCYFPPILWSQKFCRPKKQTDLSSKKSVKFLIQLFHPIFRIKGRNI